MPRNKTIEQVCGELKTERRILEQKLRRERLRLLSELAANRGSPRSSRGWAVRP